MFFTVVLRSQIIKYKKKFALTVTFVLISQTIPLVFATVMYFSHTKMNSNSGKILIYQIGYGVNIFIINLALPWYKNTVVKNLAKKHQ